MRIKFDDCILVTPELRLGALKFKIGHVTTNIPIWGTVCCHDANTSYGQPVYKIWSV